MTEEFKYTRRKLPDFPKRILSTASIGSYGGLSKADSRAPVVIEIGRRLTRIGFAGDLVPREIFRTECAFTTSRHRLFSADYGDKKQYAMLANFFKEVIFRKLLTTINSRRLVIVESVFAPTRVRNAIAQALFECPSLSPYCVLFVPSHVVCALPFNAKDCMVIDVGSEETLIFPNCMMLAQHDTTPLGASAVERRVRELLRKHAKICTALTQKYASLGEAPLRALTDEDVRALDEQRVIENIVVRFCFVTTAERGRKIQRHLVDEAEQVDKPPPDVELPFGTDTLILPGFVREAAAEVLFTPSNADARSIPQIVLDVLLRVPIDLRRVLLSRLLVIGGVARLNGFLARLKTELHSMIADPAGEYTRLVSLTDIGFFRLATDVNLELYCAWLGGSMLGNCDLFDERAVLRDDWLAQKAGSRAILDWTSRIDDPTAPTAAAASVSETRGR